MSIGKTKKKKRKSPLKVVAKWPVGRLAALIHKVGGDKKARAIVRDQLRVRLEAPLIKGLFCRPEAQIAKWQSWLPLLQEWVGVTARLEDFYDLPPTWTGGPLTATVLTLRGPSAAEELRMYWTLIKSQFVNVEKCPDFDFSPNRFRWLSGSEHTESWHFQWQLIDLSANSGEENSADDIWKFARSSAWAFPNAGILAATVLHDEWVRKMNGKKVPYVNLSGYQFFSGADETWLNIPYLWYRSGESKLDFFAASSSYRTKLGGSRWSFPVFV